MNKKQVTLNNEEIKDAIDFQKKCIETFAQFAYKYNDAKNFEIFAVGIAFIISNIMGTFGIKNINYFLDDMLIIIKQIHNDAQKNASYMEYKKGKKVSEGSFN